jgi:molybdopterin-guanine dinucleotide biosynthesis protein A
VTAARAAAFTGVVLCGGASRRMGRDKALLEVDGEPMALRVAAALRAAGATEVFAVGGDAAALTDLGLDVRPDEWPGAGPLAGTITALAAAREELVLVAACDLLRPTPSALGDTVRALVDHRGAVGAVPVLDGHRQWGQAAWHVRVAPALLRAFETGERSLRRSAEDLLVVELAGFEPAALADADVPADLP